MTARGFHHLGLGLLGLGIALPGVTTRAAIAGPPQALMVIVHPSNPVVSLNEQELRAIFTSSKRYWPNGKALVAFNAPPRSAHREAFDRSVLKMDADEAGRFWIDQQVRGGARPPRKAPSPSLAAAAVKRLPTAVAYVPVESCPDGVRVAAVIRAGKIMPTKTDEERTCPNSRR